MAEEVTIAVVGEIVKKLIDQIFRQCSYLFCYKSNIKSLQDGVQDLENTKHDVILRVNAAKRNLEEVAQRGNAWLEKVKEKEKMAQEILEGTKIVKDGCMKGWCPNLKQRYSLSRKAVKQIVIVKRLLEEGESYAQFSNSPLPAGMVASSSTTGLEVFKSRISMTNKVIDALKNESISKVGICGLGGIGKTRMAKEIRERALLENNFFNEVAMAEVSQNPNSKKIQDQLAIMLGLKLEENESVGDRGKRLRKRLTQGSRILVILDDLWDELDLWELGIPVRSQGEANGCKVLITSRSERVCKNLETLIFSVQLLSEEEAWVLFKQKAGDCVETSELRSLAEKVLNECAGLPLAIITVGSALKGCPKYEWEDALHQLKRSTVTTIEGMDKKVYASLRLSYDYLNTERSSKKKENNQLQHLFLLCCIFPENFNIPVEDLVRFSIGLRFLNDVEHLESARNRVHSLVDHLKSCHLLEHSDEEGFVKMHDVVRDFGLIEASNGEYVHMVRHDAELKQWPQSDATNLTAISIRSEVNLELPPGLDYPLLRLLLISACGSIDVSRDNFRGMKELRVLVIYDQLVSFDYGTKLLEYQAEAPELFMNVRTLCLEGCRFSTDIGLVGGMCNLEILSFRYTEKIDVLPSEIGQLKNLKLLDLRYCEVGLVESGVFSSLTKLEELYLGNYFNKEGVEELSNGNCARITELYSLSCLRRLQLNACEPGVIMILKDIPGEGLTRFTLSMSGYSHDQYIFKYKVDLRSVHLGKRSGSMFEALISRAEVVSLCRVSGWKNIMRESDIDGYLNLKKLVIEWNDDLVEICDGNIPVGSMGKLEELRLSSLNAMMYIWRGRVHPPCLINLKVFVIYKCDAIPSLFSPSVLRCLLRLEVLEISFCRLLEEIASEDAVEDDENANIITLPNLKDVKLEYLPRLGSRIALPDIIGSHNRHSGSIFSKVLLPCMETLVLNSIGGAVKVVNHEQMYSCFNLQKLEVSDCNEMEVLFDLEGVEIPDRQGEKVMVLGQLDVIKLVLLDELREIWKNVPKQGFQGFCNLRKLSVYECHNLRYLLSPCMAKLLVNLQVITIRNCDNMQHVIVTSELEELSHSGIEQKMDKIVFPRLHDLELEHLDNLTAFCSVILDLQFPLLKNVDINYCSKMKRILCPESPAHNFKDEVLLPSLETLTLNDTSAVKIVGGEIQSESLNNLRVLKVDHCHSMERLFDFEGVGVISEVHGEGVMVLGQLDAINIQSLFKLREIWKNVPKQGFQGFHNLTKLRVRGCHELTYLISPCMAKLLVNLQVIKVSLCEKMEEVIQRQGEEEKRSCGSLNNLRVLNIDYCHSIETLFNFEGVDVISYVQGDEVMVLGQLDAITMHSLNGLRDIWKNVPKQGFQGGFHNLTKLHVYYCKKLTYLLSPCMVRLLENLQVIKIRSCDDMQHVIMLTEMEEWSHSEIEKKMDKIVFLRLHQLELDNLKNLTAFCQGSYDLQFPSLKNVYIRTCSKMKRFLCSESPAHNFKEEVILPSLETLTLHDMSAVNILMCREIQRGSLNNLRAMKVSFCDSTETLFDFEGIDVIPDVHGKEVMVLGQLDSIKLRSLSELRDIWKNVPKQGGFQGSFHKLTVLDVYQCRKLRYLISPCMAKHLVNLQVIKVEKCENMEEVIQSDDEEEEKGSCGIVMNTIVFPCLRQIQLNWLPRIKAFHEGSCNFVFPLLIMLVIYDCINMNKFCSSSASHPKLQHVWFEYSSVPLMVDLNSTIQLHLNVLKDRSREGESSRIQDELHLLKYEFDSLEEESDSLEED